MKKQLNLANLGIIDTTHERSKSLLDRAHSFLARTSTASSSLAQKVKNNRGNSGVDVMSITSVSQGSVSRRRM